MGKTKPAICICIFKDLNVVICKLSTFRTTPLETAVCVGSIAFGFEYNLSNAVLLNSVHVKTV